jgi:NtrC-family two-component system sensor histidine kinase KinB
MLVITGLLWPDLRALALMDWMLIASQVLLIALVWNLGVKVTFGQVTFLPAAVLMAYLALGLETGTTVLTVGLVLGGAGQLAQAWYRLHDQHAVWWVALGEAVMWPLAQNGFSLLAADWAYRELGAAPPLTNIATLQDLSPVLTAPVVYLIVYNLMLIGDLWLQQIKIVPTLIENRRALLGIQLLPLVPIPFSVLALARLGSVSFFVFVSILIAIVIVVNRLTVAQDTLNVQVSQLRSFSAMSRALRTSLQTDKLLETTYYQVANLLHVKNLHVVLNKNPGAETPEWRMAFAVEGGKRAERELPREPDSFLKKVLGEGIILLADPVDQKARQIKADNPPKARAWMGVPLMSSTQLLGCVYTWLDHGQQPDRSFDEADLDLFGAIATQTSVALENATLYESAQQQASQLARLNQIGTLMNASLNPERVLELITDSIIEVAGCDKAAIYLLQSAPRTPDSPDLLLAHAQGFSPEHLVQARDARTTLADAERKQVMDEGQTIVVPDVDARGVLISPGALLLADREDFAAYAYLPLQAQKQSIGLLAVFYEEPHYFSDGEIELLETFSNQAALAIVNARIYQRVDIQLSRRVGQIVHMADINRRLSATLDLETIFDLIIDTAMEGCSADAGVLVLTHDAEFGEEQEGMNMVAWRGFDPARSARAPHHVAETVSDKVLQSGETLLTSVDDPEDTAGPRSQLSVPITVENHTIGAITLESEMLDAFSEEDVAYVSQLAMQAAVAIRNAQLYRRAQMVRDRLHAILDASNDGLVMIDPKSRIVMTNTRMGDFWDFARQDFSQRTPDQFLADPLTALGEGLGYREGELAALMRQGFRNPNMPLTTDLYVVRSGSRPRFVERTAAAVPDEQGNFIGLLLLFRDVTEQKELEEAREDLISMIVHDLRAPLQAVMGGMRLIGDRVSADDKIVEQATDVSTRAVKKLLNLVNNLLDLSRMEHGELAIDPSVESVNVILEDAARELMPLAQEVNAVIKIDAPDDLPYLYVDRDMIERVLLNLVDNALKFAPPGSLVALHAEQAADDKFVQVEIADKGPGVPDDYKDKIFDRFSQVPGQKGRRRSAGLGLAFCRMAVEAHRGQIWVDDNPDGGSVFTFTLPVSHAPPEAEEAKTPAEKPEAAPQPKEVGASKKAEEA